MQVVYSGGSSTPTPSPSLQRKNYGPSGGGGGGGAASVGAGGYSRPVMPGYTAAGHPPQAAPQRPTTARESGIGSKPLTEGDASLRDSIPAMKKPVAVVCFVLNVLLPGLGTLVSGLTVLCGSRVRAGGGSRGGVVRTNAGVALLQFLLTFLLLLGWIWSVMWATAFLSISDEYYKKEQQEQGGSSSSSSHRQRQKSSPAHKRGDHHQHHHHHHHHHDDNNVTSSRQHSPHPPPSFPRDHPNPHSHPISSISADPPHPHPHRNGLSVNVVGGTSTAASPAPYPTTITTSTTAERSQPIIVLQEAPVIVNHADVTSAGTSSSSSSSTLMNARTRHEKILRRQMSDNELSPFILTHERLESIVIHDAPVHIRPQRGVGSSSSALPEDSLPGDRSLPKS